MNKHDVIGEAIATIPAWLAFLDVKEAEQQAILAQITGQEAPTQKTDGVIGGRVTGDPQNGTGTAVISALAEETAPTATKNPVAEADPLAWLQQEADPDGDERLPFDADRPDDEAG